MPPPLSYWLAVGNKIDDLDARVASLEKAKQGGSADVASDVALVSRLAAIEASVAKLAQVPPPEKVDVSRIAAIEALVAKLSPPEKANAELVSRLAALEASVAKLSPPEKVDVSRLAAIEASVAKLSPPDVAATVSTVNAFIGRVMSLEAAKNAPRDLVDALQERVKALEGTKA